MKRRIALTAALVATAGLLTACGSSSGEESRPDVISVHTVNLPDGRDVLCIWERSNWDAAAGLSCDWDGITPALDTLTPKERA